MAKKNTKTQAEKVASTTKTKKKTNPTKTNTKITEQKQPDQKQPEQKHLEQKNKLPARLISSVVFLKISDMILESMRISPCSIISASTSHSMEISIFGHAI